MAQVTLARLTLHDAEEFFEAVERSVTLHAKWVEAPKDLSSFESYLHPQQQLCLRYGARNHQHDLVGVVNINAIIRGSFQNGCLGYYAFSPHHARGYMRAALGAVLEIAFVEQQLHRLEANIQPANVRSLALVESLGFRLEGLSPRYLCVAGVWCDHQRYALTAEEWQENEVA